MKKLFILRHAKSTWDIPDISDFDRPLNTRGLNDAPFMGELLAAKETVPEMIVSSPAKRAMHTAILVRESAGINPEVIFDERVYEASPQNLRQVISEFSNVCQTALIVGHNPGIEGLIRFLSGRIESMPTAALAVIDLDIESWSEIKADCGTLVEVIRPKTVKSQSG